jgi:hypothetical protein
MFGGLHRKSCPQIIEMLAKSALRSRETWRAYLDLDLVIDILLGHFGGFSEDLV